METGSSPMVASDGFAASRIHHGGMTCTDGGPIIGGGSSGSSRIALGHQNMKVKLVKRLTTYKEGVKGWAPPDSFITMLQKLAGTLTTAGRGTYKPQYKEIQHAISTLAGIERTLRKHEAEGRFDLAELNEVLSLSRVDLYMPEPEKIGYIYDGSDETQSSPSFWVKTPYGQVLHLKIRGSLQKGSTFSIAKFPKWIRCETVMCSFSPNAFLTRYRILEIFEETDPEVQDKLKEMAATPLTKDGERCFMRIGEKNEIALEMLPEDLDTIETCDKEAAKWVAEHVDDVLEYELEDSAKSLVTSAALAELYQMWPAEAEAVAKNPVRVQELQWSFTATRLGYPEYSVKRLESAIGMPLLIINYDSRIIYMGDLRHFSPYMSPLNVSHIPLVALPNGRFAPLKTTTPSFLKAAMTRLSQADRNKLIMLDRYRQFQVPRNDVRMSDAQSDGGSSSSSNTVPAIAGKNSGSG